MARPNQAITDVGQMGVRCISGMCQRHVRFVLLQLCSLLAKDDIGVLGAHILRLNGSGEGKDGWELGLFPIPYLFFPPSPPWVFA